MLFACLWLLCVGAVGGGAWYAIDSAGRQVAVLAGSRDDVDPQGAGSQDDGAATPDDPATSASGDGTPSPVATTSQASDGTTGTISGGGTPSDGATTPPASTSSSRPVRQQPQGTATTSSPRPSRTTRSPEPSQTSSTTTTTSTPPAQSRTKTASTDGGTVVVTCRVGAPLDYLVNPAQGWTADDHTSGAQEVSVKLRRRDRTIEVHATCVDGEPRTEVSEKSEDD